MVMEKSTQTPGLTSLGVQLSPKTPQESSTALAFDYQKEEEEAEQLAQTTLFKDMVEEISLEMKPLP